MSPWVNAKAKIGKFLFKCHGRKPVGIYSEYFTNKFMAFALRLVFPACLFFLKKKQTGAPSAGISKNNQGLEVLPPLAEMLFDVP